MYTVDASVWVNGFDQREPGHEISRQLLDVFRTQGHPIVVPNLLLVEVAGAISRTRNDPAGAQTFVTRIASLPTVTLVPLDNVLRHEALHVAALHGLRGADAVYAAEGTMLTQGRRDAREART